MKRIINGWIAFLFVVLGVILFFSEDIPYQKIWIGCCICFAILHVIWSFRTEKESYWKKGLEEGAEKMPRSALTELVLLSETGERLTTWNIYGKTGLVIGRDIGENHVNINLDQVVYASMIDIEHAVLNYSGNDWYIEDVSEKNGVGIEKSDGKKYKLAYGKPCKLERGDIIYIALTRLQIL